MSLTRHDKRQFAKDNPLRKVLVNSIPKSGTTWVRMMFAALPGYSVYPLDELPPTGRLQITGYRINKFFGGRPLYWGRKLAAQLSTPEIDKTPSNNRYRTDRLYKVQPGQVFHGHLVYSDECMKAIEDNQMAAVYVYRDIRDVIVSEYYHRFVLNPDKRAPKAFQGMSKEELLDIDCLLQWSGSVERFKTIRHWIHHPSVVTVKYEALKGDCVNEMKRVLADLGFRVEPEMIEHIVSSASFEKVSGRKPGVEKIDSPYRKGVVGDWRNHFDEQQKEGLKRALGEFLIEYGYEKDYDW